MEEHTEIGLIEKYLTEELSAAEKARFDELSARPDFAREIERRQLAHRLLDYAVARNLQQHLRAQQPVGKPAVAGRLRIRRLYLGLAMAASTLLLIGLFFFLSAGPQGETLAMDYYELPDNNIRGSLADEAGSEAAILDRGLQLLNNGAYQQAIAVLDSIGSTDDYYPAAQYYQAHAYYLNEQYVQAEQGFSRVAGGGDVRYQEEAQWYALLSCLAQSQACEQRLDVLTASPGHAFYRQATELARRLK